MDTKVLHLQISSGEVLCGERMGHWKDNPGGWDLGTVTTDPHKYTCPNCRARVAGTRDRRPLKFRTDMQGRPVE